MNRIRGNLNSMKKIMHTLLLLGGIFLHAGFGYAQNISSAPPLVPQGITDDQLREIQHILDAGENRPKQNNNNERLSPLAASVRLVGRHSGGSDFGSGTIIDDGSTDGTVKILTCGHIFRELGPTGVLQADIFTSQGVKKITVHPVKYDLESDVGVATFPVSVLGGVKIRATPVASRGTTFRVGDVVQSVGCGGGDDPTVQTIKVTALNRYTGPDTVECSGVPVQGRSGGGLFNKEGLVVGVCSAADPRDQRGLYAGLKAIWDLLDQAHLDNLPRPSVAVPSHPPQVLVPQTPQPPSSAQRSYYYVLPSGKDISEKDRKNPRLAIGTVWQKIHAAEESGFLNFTPIFIKQDARGNKYLATMDAAGVLQRIDPSAIEYGNAILSGKLSSKINGAYLIDVTNRDDPGIINNSEAKRWLDALKRWHEQKQSVAPVVIPKNVVMVKGSGDRAFDEMVCEVAEMHLRVAGIPRLSKPVNVTCTQVGQVEASGETSFYLVMGDGGETHVVDFRSTLQGSKERILDSVIPHEMQHVLNALYARESIPRWADEGIAGLTEDESEIKRQYLTLMNMINTNHGKLPYSLSYLMSIMEYPDNKNQMMALYAEGTMLTQFLRSRMQARLGVQDNKKTVLWKRNDNHIIDFALQLKHAPSLSDGVINKALSDYRNIFGIVDIYQLNREFYAWLNNDRR